MSLGLRAAAPAPAPSTAKLAALLVVSGAASLVYEVVWARKLSWFLGADVYAVSVVLAAFFGGLGIGSAVCGRRVDRSTAPLRLYAGLELATALVGLGLIPVLDHLPEASLAMPAWLPHLPWLSTLAHWSCAFVLLLVPTTLIGGTFPVVSRAAVRRTDEVGTRVGWLYTANTVGALLGTVLAGFVLMRWLGIDRSLVAAAAANLCAAAYAWHLAAQTRGAATTDSRLPPIDTVPRRRLVALLAAGSGFIALASEVLWTRAIIQVLASTHAYAFTVVLATYLLGIALGSALLSRRMPPPAAAWGWFVATQAAAALLTVTALLLLRPGVEIILGHVAPALQQWSGSLAVGFFTKTVVLAACILLPATIAGGASFPLLVDLACGSVAHLGARVGWLYAANTAGGIAGSLAGALLLLPWLGLQRSLYACAALNLVLGLAAWRHAAAGARRRTGWALAVAATGVGAVVWLVPAAYMIAVATRIMEGSLLFFREDARGTVAVMREPFLGRSFNRLLVDGVSNSGDQLPSQRYMRLQTHLPVLLHGPPVERVLVICFGTGITYDASFRHPEIGSRRCVELSPAVLAAAPLFAAANHSVATRPDADIRIADGRAFLLSDDERYDVITLEPPPPIARGVVNLYSKEFYELCRRHLRPGGMMAQWVPLTTQNLETTRMLMRTFQDVFPHTTLWSTELHETMLLGTLEPLRIDVRAVSEQMAAPALARSLGEVGIRNAAQLFATFLMDESAVRAFTAGVDLVTDDRPRIEYAPLQVAGEFPPLLRALLDARADLTALPGVSAAPPALLVDMYRQRDALLTFYAAAMAAESGDVATTGAALSRVLPGDPDNPYYRWFFVP